MKNTKKDLIVSPITLPIIVFGGIISVGTVLLHSSMSIQTTNFSWIDSLFISTSATCVTGLSVADVPHTFTSFGHFVIMVLIQLGGLGIMTYTSLVFYLWRKRISLTDRIAVGRNLLHDPSFHLGSFLKRIVLWTFIIEGIGALLLYIQAPKDFFLFSAVFHSISAFCNAGFSLFSDSLIKWQGSWGINLVFMVLIVLGGIGFSVLMELFNFLKQTILSWFKLEKNKKKLSWYALVVLKTSLFLIVAGWAGIYCAEFVGFQRDMATNSAVLSSLFQSVTCRTAGFNTIEISQMTNVSLLFMIILMFIGGAPGSCAGGIKISTFRVIAGYISSQLKGRQQVVVDRYAIDNSTLNRSMILIIFSFFIIVTAVIILNITEGGDIPHPLARGLGMEILFEVVSAFGTVGLSTGLTPKLTEVGKLLITMLMFIGRLGPILFIVAIQSFQQEESYLWPEESMLIG